MPWQRNIPDELQKRYEIHEYHHASAILMNEFSKEFKDICGALAQFSISINDITTPGGNESDIPKKIRQILEPKGWKESQLDAEVSVGGVTLRTHSHKIDFVKGRVAFDFEWNSKDQTFDRDLYAFSGFFEYDRISVGVIVTRSRDLDVLFEHLGDDIKKKYGASTTHIEKLLPRLNDWRHRGCPILVFGITRAVVSGANAIMKK